MSRSPIKRRQVRDLSNNRIGEVMDENVKGSLLHLRPVGGGIEWEAPADGIQDVDPPQPQAGMHKS